MNKNGKNENNMKENEVMHTVVQVSEYEKAPVYKSFSIFSTYQHS